MKKLIYILAFLLPFSGFTQNSRAFYGSSVSRSYGVDTLAGFKAVNTNTLGYAGLVAISASDTSVFFTNGTGYASIYNSAGVLRQPQYVGIGGSPDVSGTAYLSLTGTAGGFLTARMTAAQKSAIVSPATGLLIYQTDGTAGFYYYNGSAWGAVGGGSSGITVGTTTITGGGDYRILFQDATASDFVTQSSDFTYGKFFAGYLNVLTGYAINGYAFLHKAANGLCVGNNNTLGDYNVAVGQSSGNSLNASSIGNIGVGWGSLNGVSSGDYNICIGQSTGGSNTSNSICIGAYTTCNANNTFVSGGSTASGTWISSVYFGSGITDVTAQSVTFNATGGSGTNNAGASLTLASGKGTGTAAGGNNVEQTSVKLASGTTLQPLTDRHNIVGKYVDITAGSAQTFGNLALATSSTVSGGTVIYTIEANDATDYQSLSGVLKYDVVNKAGTLTVAFEDDQNSACACSAGTLTATVTATASGTNVLFQANAVSSLTETTLRVSFQVLNNMGQAVVTPN